MGNTVDKKTVELNFDNQQFESGVRQSMDSLTKLDQKLSAGGKGKNAFGKLQEAANNLNLSPVHKAFTGLLGAVKGVGSAAANVVGGIGHTAVSTAKGIGFGIAGLTAGVAALAATGGVRRALNIEQAKFQLEGLGIAWKDIQEDINYAVEGTAYGLDSAAKAASQLSASGVKLGDDMKSALRGISGVAAMANSDFDSMAQIFTAVAGQGKVMTQQLRQLELRGLNPSATMAKYFTEVNNGTQKVSDGFKQMVAEATGGGEVTEAAIRDLVSKGTINFEMFAKAMDSAFGEHAKDANKTFTGAMANVKAALSRIGAEFAAPGMESLRKIFVDLIPVINNLKVAMGPVFDAFSKITDQGQKLVSKVLEPMGQVDEQGNKKPLQGWVDTFQSIGNFLAYNRNGPIEVMKSIEKVAPQWADAMGKMFGSLKDVLAPLGKDLERFGIQFNLSSLVEKSGPAIEKFSHAFGIFAKNLGFFVDRYAPPLRSALSYIGNAMSGTFGRIAQVMTPFLVIVRQLGTIAGDVLVYLGTAIADFLGTSEEFGSVLDGMSGGLASFLWDISAALPSSEKVVGALDSLRNGLSSFFEFVGIGAPNLSGIAGFFSNIGSSIGGFLTAIKDGLSGNGETMLGSFFGILKSLVHEIGELGKVAFDDILRPIGSAISEFTSSLLESFKNLSGGDIAAILSGGLLAGFAAGVSNLFGTMKQTFGGGIHDFLFGLEGLTGGEDGGKGLAGKIDSFLYSTERAFTAFQTNLQAGTILKIAGAIAVLALSLKSLASLDAQGLMTGLAGVTMVAAVITEMFMAFEAITAGATPQQIGMMYVVGNTMLKLAEALMIMSVAVRVLGDMDTMSIAKGLVAIVVVIKVLTDAMASISELENGMGAAAAAMIAMSVALLLLSASVAIFGKMKPETLIQGGIAITYFATLMVAAFSALDGVDAKSLLSASAAMIAAALSMAVIAGAVMALSVLDPGTLVTTMGVLALGLAAMAVAAMAMEEALPGAAAMLVMAAAIAVLTPSLVALSLVPVPGLIAGILAMAAAMIALGATAMLLEPAIVAMFELSVVLGIIGVAMLVAGAGMLMFAKGFAILAAAGAAGSMILVEAIKGILLAIIEVIPEAATALANGLTAFITAIAENAGQIAEAFVTLGLQLLEALRTLIPQIAQVGLEIIVALLTAIANHLPVIVALGITILVRLIEGLAEGLPLLVQAGVDLALSFIDSLANGIRDNYERVILAGQNLMLALGEAIIGTITELIPGSDAVLGGLMDSLAAKSEEVAARSEELANASSESLNQGLAEMQAKAEETAGAAGDVTIDGIAGGLLGGTGVLEGAGGELGSSIDSGFSQKLESLPDTAGTKVQAAIDIVNGKSAEFDGAGSRLGTALQNGFKNGVHGLETEGRKGASNAVSGIKTQNSMANAAGRGLGTFASNGLRSGISGMKSAAQSGARSAANSVNDYKGTAYSGGYSTGQNAAWGMRDGINSAASSAATAAANMVTAAISAAKKAADEGSPSKEMAKRGRWFVLGFAKGIDDNKKFSDRSSDGMVKSAIGRAVEGFGEMTSLLDGIDYNPTIRPVFDGSQLRAGIQNANKMLLQDQILAAGYAGRSYNTDSGSSDNSVKSTNVTVNLQYDAGTDVNFMAMELASALNSRILMEG